MKVSLLILKLIYFRNQSLGQIFVVVDSDLVDSKELFGISHGYLLLRVTNACYPVKPFDNEITHS